MTRYFDIIISSFPRTIVSGITILAVKLTEAVLETKFSLRYKNYEIQTTLLRLALH